jgi:hypothetical protein
MDPRRITCAVCRKPVQRTEWWDDYSKGDRVLRVYCHGATQDMRLDMMRVSPDTLRALEDAQGVAFDVGALAGPNDSLSRQGGRDE